MGYTPLPLMRLSPYTQYTPSPCMSACQQQMTLVEGHNTDTLGKHYLMHILERDAD